MLNITDAILLVLAICGSIFGRQRYTKVLSIVFLITFSIRIFILVCLGTFAPYLIAVSLILFILSCYACIPYRVFHKDSDNNSPAPPPLPTQKTDDRPSPQHSKHNSHVTKFLAYIWDFIFGVILILGVPSIILIVVSIFLMRLLPNCDILNTAFKAIYAIACQAACFAGPLGLFLVLINYRKKHRLLPPVMLTVEVICAIMLFAAAIVGLLYLTLTEAAADGIL